MFRTRARHRAEKTPGRLRAVLLVAALGAAVGSSAPHATAAGSHTLIQGSGSSWSSNAVNQWVADVQTNGLQVVFTSSGSAQGRKDFGYRTTDFGVSDIGYLGTDPLTGEADTTDRKFAYLPIVAGGTAFPYQLKVSGQQVKNLRLSGTTLTKIFTNQIRSWDDPAITADNNGKAFPAIPIIPVIHSEGSGSTAQFTRFMDTEYPNLWRPFLGQAGSTEYYPHPSGSPAISQNGSDGVMNFIAPKAANGSIGYDEYSYSLNKGYPVAKILNAAGYYTAPDQYNVAVALTKAEINNDKNDPNYLLQKLDNVYTNDRPQTYPLSSYSYLILPTGTSAEDDRINTAKRQTMADFLYYSLCQGQKEMGPIGYSPLPVNLVQSAFDQVNKLKQADPAVDITQRDVTTCQNPTFDGSDLSKNRLAEIAPLPQDCDKQGAGPCAAISTTKPDTTTTGSGSGSTGSGTSSGTKTTTGGTKTTTGTSSGGGTTTNADGTTTGTDGTTDPNATGNDGVTVNSDGTLSDGSSTGDGTATDNSDVPATSALLAGYSSSGMSAVLGPLAVVLLVLALIAPPLVSYRLRQKQDGA